MKQAGRRSGFCWSVVGVLSTALFFTACGPPTSTTVQVTPGDDQAVTEPVDGTPGGSADVEHGEPTATILLDPATGYLGETVVTLSATWEDEIDGAADIVTITVDWGDDDIDIYDPTTVPDSATHVYANSGAIARNKTFTIKVTVEDLQGNSAFDTENFLGWKPMGATFDPGKEPPLAATSNAAIEVNLAPDTYDFVCTLTNNVSGVIFNGPCTFPLAGADGINTLTIGIAPESGEVAPPSVSVGTWIMDLTPPVVTSVQLAGGAVATANPSVGVSIFGGADMAQVRVTGDIGDSGWISFASLGNVTLLGADGNKTVWARGRDDLGNESAAVADSITLDRTPPTLTSVSLAGGASAISSTTVNLTVVAGGDASQMRITGDVSDSGWIAFSASQSVTLLGGDGTKNVYVQVRDALSNASAALGDDVTLDRTAPTLTSATLAGGAAAVSATTVNLTVVAGGDASQMRITGDVSDSGWIAYSASQNITLLGVDGTKNVWVRVRDTLGNVAAAKGDAITLDRTAPTLTSMTLAAGASPVSTATVNLTVVAGGDAAQMRITGDVSDSGWIAYTASQNVTLQGGDGAKNVYVRVRDALSNTSAALGDDVTLDQTPPTQTSVTLAGGESPVSTATVNLTVVAVGDAAEMRITGDVSDSGWIAYAASQNVALLGVDGLKNVYVQVRDALNNASAAMGDDLMLDRTAPTLTSALIAGGANVVSATTVQLATVAGGDAAEMLVTGTVDMFGWQPYAASRTITLTTLNGANTAYVRMRDALDNTSGPIFDTIIHDNLAPTGTLAAAPTYTNGTTAALMLSASDANGPIEMRLTGDITGGVVGQWIPFAAVTTVTLSAGEGAKTFAVSYRDVLQNVGATYQQIVTKDTTSPSVAVTTPANGALLAAIPNPIRGTAADAGSPMTTVTVSIFDGTMYWDGAGFNALAELQLGATGMATWSQAGPFAGSDGVYTIRGYAWDSAGNQGITASTLTLDQTAPSCVTCMAIDAPRYPWTNVQTVSLNLDAADLHGPLKMKLTGDIQNAMAGMWISFAATTDVTLTAGDGEKTVTV